MQSDWQLYHSVLFFPLRSHFLRSVSLDPQPLCGYERDLRPVLCGGKNWGLGLIERGHGAELKDRIDLAYNCWTRCLQLSRRALARLQHQRHNTFHFIGSLMYLSQLGLHSDIPLK